jgi:acyl-CoA synthetase (AMP-forming)/AMP-acid ligase II
MNNAVAKGVEEEIAATIDTSTINGRLRAHMATQGGSPAIWIAPGQSRSFSQMYDIVDHIAAALRRHVEVAHPRIAFATPRGAAGVYGFLASIELGTCCPIDARLKEAELVDALVALAPDAVLLAGTEPAVLAAANHAGIPAIAFNLDSLMGECTVGHHAPRATTRQAQRPALLLRGEETPAILMRTSGTTASPKLVGLSHANITAATEVMKEVFELTPHDICLTPMPLYHVHGLIAGALSALSAGSSIHCNETFSPQLFDQALRDFSPTWLTAAPALHLAMCDFYSSGGRTPGISSLRRFRSSSAPLPPSSFALLEQLYDAPLLETYGLTETASTICSNLLPPRRRKPGSVGVPINTEMLILDEADRPAAAGIEGEILLRGAGVIQEYLGSPQPEAFWNGWLRTGDLGRVDEDGYLYVVGRKKEVIKRGGHSVFPLEIDNVMITHPAVAEAITFAIPHDTLGEDVIAAVVGKPGHIVDSASIKQHVAEAMSSYKIPSRILVVDSIPRNSIGKALRREMPGLLAFRLAPEAVAPTVTLERTLLEVWHGILRRADIGVTDNVFQFGADPLRAELAAGLIAERTGHRLTTKVLYSSPTVREQAEFLNSKGADHASSFAKQQG